MLKVRDNKTYVYAFYCIQFIKDFIDPRFPQYLTIGQGQVTLAEISYVVSFPDTDIDYLLIRVIVLRTDLLPKVHLLMKLGANPTRRNCRALELAVIRQSADLVFLLLQYNYAKNNDLHHILCRVPEKCRQIRGMIYHKLYETM